MTIESEGLTSAELSILNNAIDFAATQTANTLAFLVIATAAGIITSRVNIWNKERKAKQNFNSNNLEIGDIIIAATEYQKINHIHEKTGKATYRQCLTTYSIQDLECFFPKEWVDLVSKNLKKAKGLCNEDNPCLLLHLANIIDEDEDEEDDNDTTIRKLNKELTNGVSATFNDETMLAINRAKLKEGEEVSYFTHIPFLIYEDSAEKKQMRLLLVRIQDLLDDKISNLEEDHVFYHNGYDEYGKEIYSNREDHPQALRLKTFKNLIKIYRENRDMFQPLKIYEDKIIPINHDNYTLQHRETLDQ